MSAPETERLNVYDASGQVVGSAPRGEANANGFAAGAVQLLLFNPRGQILLQRRRADKENGGLWDKSVGGHVQAGESFDEALVREANEELFGRADADQVALVADLDPRVGPFEPRPVRVRRVRLELGLRDIRFAAAPDRPLINVTYHAAMYLGRSELPIESFSRQEAELSDLRYFAPGEVDRLLVRSALAPNMAFLWFALGGSINRL